MTCLIFQRRNTNNYLLTNAGNKLFANGIVNNIERSLNKDHKKDKVIKCIKNES